MTKHSYLLVLSITIAATLFVLPMAAFSANKPSEFLNPNAVSITKSANVLPDGAREFLSSRDGDTVKVWVFFKDKGVSDKNSFDRAASSIVLGERALKRRVKVKLDQVVFADLPVYSDYILEITDLGGKHRHTSRWQNAASFEIPFNKLADIAELPFVTEVRPLGTYKRPALPEPDLKNERFEQKAEVADGMNYGSSAAQITQIKVNLLHAQGYHGEGVTLAILDTGFRKTHIAFNKHYSEGRVLAEHDFIFNDSNTANEPGDVIDQWSHGTLIWSVSGGESDGSIYGPAFKANFLLAKTEYIPTETPVEEDNWVAAVEWADSLGADVITSSLGYIDWYTPANLDGATAVTTLQANMAASLGIVLCNAAGNGGSGPSTLIAPADAFDILAVGSVNSFGTIANSSSRGPTADGRIKPEVCARGVSTWAATSGNDNSYGTASGTSLATPLVAGAACLMVQARPNYPPEVIRQAFMSTASNAGSPNNSYGWGVIDASAAIEWGAEFNAGTTQGDAPLTVQFTANTSLAASGWDWDFGDGGISSEQNPSYQYTTPGTFNVSLTIQTEYGPVTNTKIRYIAVNGDSLEFESDSAFAGNQVAVSVNVNNTQELESIIIPFKFGFSPEVVLDSVIRGTRTNYFEQLVSIGTDPGNHKYGFQLFADVGGGALPLAPGNGEVLKLFFTIDSAALGGQTALVDSASFLSTRVLLTTPTNYYTPLVFTGGVSTKAILRGDANYDFKVNILDLSFLVDRFFRGGQPPPTIQSADFTLDYQITIEDLTYLVDWIFRGGTPPPSP